MANLNIPMLEAQKRDPRHTAPLHPGPFEAAKVHDKRKRISPLSLASPAISVGQKLSIPSGFLPRALIHSRKR